MTFRVAAGAPGMEPRWTSSAKSGVGTALDARSRVWFTLAYGIVNEVYYPRVDQANTRDLGLLVSGPGGYFAEEKRDAASVVSLVAPGVPAYRLVNTAHDGRWRVTKTVVTHPEHDVLLQQVRLELLGAGAREAGAGTSVAGAAAGGWRVFALLAPHLGNQGWGNDAWVGDYKGVPLLFARRGDTALALGCSAGWCDATAGYVGTSDGWQDVRAHGRLTTGATAAPDGNVALCGEVDFAACAGPGTPRAATFVLALGFGRNAAEAGQHVRLALAEDFARVVGAYVRGWTDFHARALPWRRPTDAAATYRSAEPLERHAERGDGVRFSTAVLRTHDDRDAPGGMIASLSIPWGQTKGDHDLGGYHLVWPRDLVECAGALLAAGHHESARRTLRFLMATQEADGHWPQNMWLDGGAYWNGVQLDETAFPILLADQMARLGALDGIDPWPTVRAAAAFLVSNGPVTQQDRWEEDPGYSPFTLAVEIAALLAAADAAARAGDPVAAAFLREVADDWNAGVERWTYVTDTPLARSVGVAGYYARIAPPDVADAPSPATGWVPIKNRADPALRVRYDALVSPDALALVRFGLRDARDPRILDTVRVIDAVLRTETPTGPAWHRYNGDGYGEQADGTPFDGVGVGRGWPLLAGERGHWELAAGHEDEARRLLGVMAAQASDGGLIPEQVWDADALPAQALYPGRPAGSAMPLAWAHAEYLKLARSIHDGAVFDLPPQARARYAGRAVPARVAFWSPNHRVRTIAAGQRLRVLTAGPAVVRWRVADAQAAQECRSSAAALGLHAADLATEECGDGTALTVEMVRDEEPDVVEQWTVRVVAGRLRQKSAGAPAP